MLAIYFHHGLRDSRSLLRSLVTAGLSEELLNGSRCPPERRRARCAATGPGYRCAIAAHVHEQCLRGEGTAATFWLRARSFFGEHNITITSVMTDNGSCYRSRAFAAALARPSSAAAPARSDHGPATRSSASTTRWPRNGRTPAPDRSEPERGAAFETWLHRYNHHRHHRLGGPTLAECVHNLTWEEHLAADDSEQSRRSTRVVVTWVPFVAVATARRYRASDKIRRRGRGKLTGLESNKVLYHYTSAIGLLGIVEKRRLWATESNFLNDPSEISYAATVVMSNLAPLLTDPALSIGHRAEVERAWSWIAGMYMNAHTIEQYHEERSFITRFSFSEDVLTLWRSYAGANGFCVGFDADKLVSFFEKGYPDPEQDSPYGDNESREGIRTNFALVSDVIEVAYGDEVANKLADQVIALVAQPNFTLDSQQYTLSQALRSLVSVKHPAYADEREARLVVHRTGDFSPDPLVRASPSTGLVAYHEVAFPRDALVSITTAPGAGQKRAENAVHSLLRDGGRGGWDHVRVRSADIPFTW